MKIQIIGLGIVGTAQALLAKEFGHEVVGYDIRSMSHPYCKVNDNVVENVDITFICTPETVVEEVMSGLANIGHKGLIVIKSTVPIGTTKQLTKKFGVHICHNPEFLREQHYLEEVLDPNMTVIGQCCKKHGNLLKEFYQPLDKPTAIVDYNTSEVIKLAMNAYLSTLITFWNEIDEISKKLGLDTKNISETVRHDPRVSNYGNMFFGLPYEGKCLSKDMKHLIRGFHSCGLNPKLFEACENFNDNLKGTKTKLSKR